MKPKDYAFPLQSVQIGKKNVMIQSIPGTVGWNTIQEVAGQVVVAIRLHINDPDVKLGEIRIRKDNITFTGDVTGGAKAWVVKYSHA